MADTVKEMSVKLKADVSEFDSVLDKSKTKWLDFVNGFQQGFEKLNGGAKRTVTEVNKSLDDIAGKVEDNNAKQIKSLSDSLQKQASEYKKGSAEQVKIVKEGLAQINEENTKAQREAERIASQKTPVKAKDSPEFKANLDKQRVAEEAYLKQQSVMRHAAVAEAETDGAAQLVKTKARLIAEADLAQANAKRLEAILNTQLAKVKGNAEQEFRVRSKYEKMITNEKIKEAKKRDASEEVVHGKIISAARYGEDVTTIIKGGLGSAADADFAGMGATIGGVIGGPLGGTLGTAIGEGVSLGMKGVDALMDAYDPGRLFEAATKRVDELTAATEKLGDSIEGIGKDIQSNDIAKGFDDMKASLDDVKVISPEIADAMKMILDMQGGKTAEDLEKLKALMEDVNKLGEEQKLVKQFEQADNAIGATTEQLGQLVDAADESMNLGTGWMKAAGAGLTVLTGGLGAFITAGANAATVQTLETGKLEDKLKDIEFLMADTRNTAEQNKDLAIEHAKVEEQLHKIQLAKKQVAASYTADLKAQLNAAEKAKGSALEEAEIQNLIAAGREKIIANRDKELVLNNRKIATDEEIDAIAKSTEETYNSTLSIQAETNGEIQKLLDKYNEGVKLLDQQLDTIIAQGATEEEKNQIEKEGLEAKIVMLQAVDEQLAAQESAIIAAIQAQEASALAEEDRLKLAQALADKQAEIGRIIKGEQTQSTALTAIQKNDLYGALQAVQKERDKVQKGIASLQKQVGEVGKKKGGGGGAAKVEKEKEVAEDIFNKEQIAAAKEAADAAFKQHEEEMKKRREAFAEELKTKEEERKRLADAAEKRADLEKELAAKLGDFIDNLRSQIANLRNAQFQGLGSIVSKFISPLQTAIVEANKFGVALNQGVDAIKQQGEAAIKEAKELDDKKRAEREKAQADVNALSAQIDARREQTAIDKAAALDGRIMTGAQAEAAKKLDLFNAVLDRFSKDLEAQNTAFTTPSKTWQADVNAASAAAHKTAIRFGTVDKDLGSLAAKIVEEGKTGRRSGFAAAQEGFQTALGNVEPGLNAALATANKEAEKARQEKVKGIKEAADAAEKADMKEIKRISELYGLNVQLSNAQIQAAKDRADAANAEAEKAARLKPLADLNAQLKLLTQIMDLRNEILEIEKATKDETDLSAILKAQTSADEKQLKLKEQLLAAGINAEDIESKILAIRARINQDSELTAELHKAENEETLVSFGIINDVLKENFETNRDINKQTAVNNQLRKADFQNQLDLLEAAKERGEYDNDELTYLTKRAALLKLGTQQVGTPPPPDPYRNQNRKAPAPPTALQAGTAKSSEAADRDANKRAEANLQTTKETLGLVTEKEKVDEKYAELQGQINSLLANQKITQAEMKQLSAEAAEMKALELEALQKAVDTLADSLGMLSEIAKIDNKRRDTQLEINRLRKAGLIDAKKQAEMEKHADMIKATEKVSKVTGEIANQFDNVAKGMQNVTSIVEAFGSGDVMGGIEAGADLAQTVGQALMTGAPGTPLAVVGAFLVGGALIAKAINEIMKMIIPTKGEEVNKAQEQAKIEKSLLELEQSRLGVMQNLIDLGDKALDQAKEQLEYARKIHELHMQESAEANTYANDSIQALTDRKKALEETKKAQADLARNAENALAGGEKAQEAFLRSIGMSDKGTDKQIADRIQSIIDQQGDYNEQLETSISLIDDEIEFRKTDASTTRAALDEEIALYQLRSKIQGESIANLNAIKDVQREILDTALEKAGVNSLGMDNESLENLLATAEGLPQSVIDAANAWIDARKAVDDYVASAENEYNDQIALIRAREKAEHITKEEADAQVLDVLEKELAYLVSIGASEMSILDIEAQILEIKREGNSATDKQNKALTEAVRTYEDLLLKIRAVQGSGTLTAQQQGDLATQRAAIAATLKKGGASDEEIAAFLKDLPGYAAGGVVGRTGTALVTKGEMIVPQKKAENLFKAIDAFVSGNQGLYDAATAKYSSSLKNPLFTATDLDRYMGKIFADRERAGFYNSNVGGSVKIGDIYINIRGDVANPQAAAAAVKGEMDQLANNINSLLQQNKIDKRQGVAL